MGSPPAGYTARPAILLDLDGTLFDSVYQQHVLALQEALEAEGIELGIRAPE